ncbi:MAG TPA: TonB-dependent receptor [Allosphingosinicella sp.]|jgi:iron complex outermembrane receptor protein|nr:TonB-dependent receptor [Allosphingosinicella sp.]
MTRTRFTTLLKAGAALAAIAAGAPAYAQEQGVEDTQTSEEAAAAANDEAQSPDTTGADAALIGEDILVTARRREESLQDVPISVSAFSGEALENQGAVDITALQQQTPNLTLQIARGSNSTLIAFIRGIGQQDPVWGFEPGVGLYIDDVYVARPQGAVLDIFDVERVEVLRGPQGTLYGRNTIGGAIKYVTRRLGNDFEARVRGAYGSYNQMDLSGTVTLPVQDNFAIGAGFAIYKRDGFGENLFTGAEHYNKDVWAARLSMEWSPIDTISVRIAADKTDDESNPRHGHREVGNAGLANFEPPASVYDTRAGVGDENNVETSGISGTIEVEISPEVTFKSITAWRKGHTETVIDFDGTPGPVLDIPSFYRDKAFTQEMQVLFNHNRLQGVVGLYYISNSASGAFDTVVGNVALPGRPVGLTTVTTGDVDTKSYAAFADVSFDITEQLAISLGGRYTHDRREGTVFRQQYAGIRSPLFGNGAAQLLGAPRTNYTNERTFEEFTPRASISYKPTEDLMVYASYSNGFKSGGFDPRGDAVLVPNTSAGYNPEKVDAYELGLKGNAGRKLFFNLAGFYSKYKGQQVTQQYLVGSTVASEVVNVGRSTIYGAEFEGRAVFSRALSATASVGYTHARFDTFVSFDPATLTVRELADERSFQNTPKWNGNLTVNYVHDLGNGGSIAFTPAMSFRTSYTLFEIANPTLDENGYALFDASLVWTSENERFQLGAHARNITDERYRVGGYVFPGALTGNSLIAFYGPPRTFTVSAAIKF